MSVAASVMSYGRTLADLLYPPACLLCGVHLNSSIAPLCDVCEAAMPRIGLPRCERCGMELPGAYDAHVICTACQRHPPSFDQACAPFAYAEAAREAIHAFKYQGRHRLGSWLAASMAQAAQRALPLDQIKAVVPVPLHWVKRRLRRLDPPVFLAHAMARALERPYVPLLRRIRWTATQTTLNPSGRIRNVEGAFGARSSRRLSGGVLLVDDVMTSGATVNACAQALRDVGIQPVYVVTAARTPTNQKAGEGLRRP
ncbi:MAG: ComF family protein [Candidatus Omnitrophica bacterium]|nr:ComF family protein [Candidatus Omnitrophota bacterium]